MLALLFDTANKLITGPLQVRPQLRPVGDARQPADRLLVHEVFAEFSQHRLGRGPGADVAYWYNIGTV